MASFGRGFVDGLSAGSDFVGGLRDTYDKIKKEEAINGLFTAALDKKQLEAEGADLEAEGAQRAGVMDMIGNASMGDITQAIVGNFAANGGKVNDETYKLAMGVASTLFGVKQNEQEWQQKNVLFGQKIRANEATIANTYDKMNKRVVGGGSGGYGGYGGYGKPTSFMKEAAWIRENYGEEAMNNYLDKKGGLFGGSKKEEKQPKIKDITTARDTAKEINPDLANLTPQEQYEAGKIFNKTGQVPEVEVAEDGGFMGSGFFKEKSYKLKGSEQPVKKEAKPKEAKPKNGNKYTLDFYDNMLNN